MRTRRPRNARTSALALLVAAAVMLSTGAACSGRVAPTQPDRGTEPTPSVTPTPSPDGSETAGAAPLDELRLGLEPVVTGLESPLFVTHAGDGSGRLFVVEQGGLVRVAREGQIAGRPFLDLRARVSSGGERGLLGLAFAEDYETSGRFYVNYTDAAGDTVVARYTAAEPASDNPKLSAPQVVLTVDQPFANHNGGCLAFAPDGTLWVGMGDGGSAGDPGNRAQNRRGLLGKLLSLDVEGSERPEPKIVGLGLRNPWRFSFDRETGGLWIGDVGQNAWEEIDFLPWAEAQGRNFGWNRWEGSHPYPEGSQRSRGDFVFPVAEYGRDDGISVTGGYVYRGQRYPALEETYLYADFGSGRVWGARLDSAGKVGTRLLIEDSGTTPSSFGEDEDGEVYLVDYNGRIMRVVGTRR